MKIRELPRLTDIVQTMDDVFVPNDCADDEILCRTGRIICNGDPNKIKEFFMAHSTKNSEKGWNLLFLVKENNSWETSTGMINDDSFENEVENYMKQQKYMV